MSEDSCESKSDDSWNDCKTGRKDQAEILTQLLVNRYESYSTAGVNPNTYTLNIDAPWGYGKTFFIERWAKDLTKTGYLTIFFNAWEQDYSNDALTCLLASIYSQMEEALTSDSKENNKLVKMLGKVKDSMINVAKKSAPALIGAATMATIGVNVSKLLTSDEKESYTDDATRKFFESMGKEVGDELFKSRVDYKSILSVFKENMKELMKLGSGDEKFKLPIVVFIDDLDRCRPKFSLEVIECIKHILDIDGIYFVFATDAKQLNQSIKGIYGQDYDAEYYMKRIFNQECRLKEPDREQFSKHLFSKEMFNLGDYNFEFLIFPEKEVNNATESLAVWFFRLADLYKMDLRHQIYCASLIENILFIRKGKSTLVLILMHLVIIWGKNKNAAELQSVSKTLMQDYISGNNWSVESISYKINNGGSEQFNVDLCYILRVYYTSVGSYSKAMINDIQYGECTEFEKGVKYGLVRSIDMGNIVKSQEISYVEMMNQIKMTA